MLNDEAGTRLVEAKQTVEQCGLTKCAVVREGQALVACGGPAGRFEVLEQPQGGNILGKTVGRTVEDEIRFGQEEVALSGLLWPPERSQLPVTGMRL